jgi:hypothetical protein
MTAWLDAAKAKRGVKVTLKDSADPTRWWTITGMGTPREKGAFHEAHDAKDWYKNDYRQKLHGLSYGTPKT